MAQVPVAPEAGNGVSVPHILFVVNVDWFFLSHRISLAKAARDRGARVTIAAGDTGASAAIRAEGFPFIPLPLSRKGTSPLAEIALFRELLRLYRTIRPDLIHHVTIKPVIYGSVAARMAGNGAILNAVSGLGYAFSPGVGAALIRPAVRTLYRLALKPGRTLTIFQNPDDREYFVGSGLVRPEQAVLIRGSGVDCAKFVPGRHGVNAVVLAGRMLWDKGIAVFVEAARRVRSSFPDTRFILVGGIDTENPAAISASEIARWTADGVVEWWGQRSDMAGILGDSRIAVLPSLHREGLPKVLLEAAACALPLIASDVPGCREIVRHEVNGLLVPAGNPSALAEAVEKLLQSQELRESYGRAGRTIVEKEFAEEIVVRQTMDLYARTLGRDWPIRPAVAQ